MSASFEHFQTLENKREDESRPQNIHPVNDAERPETHEIAKVRSVDRERDQADGAQNRIQEYLVAEKFRLEQGTPIRSPLQDVDELTKGDGGVTHGRRLEVMQTVNAVQGQGHSLTLHVEEEVEKGQAADQKAEE